MGTNKVREEEEWEQATELGWVSGCGVKGPRSVKFEVDWFSG